MGIRVAAALAACVLLSGTASAYDHFHVAVYCRAQEVQKMADPQWLEQSWQTVSSEVHVDKVYIETHRDRILIDDATLEAAKKFFLAHGVQVAGGITFTVSEPNRFETFSYSNPEHRRIVQQIADGAGERGGILNRHRLRAIGMPVRDVADRRANRRQTRRRPLHQRAVRQTGHQFGLGVPDLLDLVGASHIRSLFFKTRR